MTPIRRVAALAATLALTTAQLFSQTPQPKPSFDVISIKPSPPLGTGPFRIGGGAQGERFTMTNATLRMLLQTAYQQVGNTPLGGQMQVIGGPSWMESDRFDVLAKTDCSGGSFSRDRLQLMVQSLLEDRFHLKAHKETRELPTYNLVVAKDGPKLKKSADQTAPTPVFPPPVPCEPASANPIPPPPFPGGRGDPFGPGAPPPPRGALMMSTGRNGTTMRATATPLTTLVGLLSNQLGRTVVDKTGLAGLYDFELTFNPEGLSSPFGRGLPPPPDGAPPGGPVPSAPDSVASLFTAIQDLGLKLEPGKGPLEVFVIDSVEKPTEN